MFCKYCGAEIREESTYCEICGKKVGKAETYPINRRSSRGDFEGKRRRFRINGILAAIIVIIFMFQGIWYLRTSEAPEDSLSGKEDEFNIIGIWTVESSKKTIDPLREIKFDDNPKIQIEVIAVSDDESEITILYTGTESYHDIFWPGETYVGSLVEIESDATSIRKTYSVSSIQLDFKKFYYYGNVSDLRELCAVEGLNFSTDLWRSGMTGGEKWTKE